MFNLITCIQLTFCVDCDWILVQYHCFPAAVIGAGIGGTATAYFLRQEFGTGIKIDVFEAGTVGGRLATVKVGDVGYETGGSVIHPLNLHMKHFVDTLGECDMYLRLTHATVYHPAKVYMCMSRKLASPGLSPRKDVPSKMAIFDGEQLIFEESDWVIVNFFRMLWRYGLNFLRMQMWVEGMLDKFMRYQLGSTQFMGPEGLLELLQAF